MLSGPTVSLASGVLSVAGTADADTIHVGLSGADVVVAYSTTQNGTVIASGAVHELASAVQQVRIDGNDGNDVLDASGFSGPVTILGGAGDDMLTGGSDNSILDGGAGTNTVIDSGDTNFVLSDSLLIGNGHASLANIQQATLSGGPGNNTLDVHQFHGVVTLHGGDGDDTLIAGLGTGLLDGGAGTNTVIDSGNVDFELSDSLLLGTGTYTLLGIQKGRLTGGSDDNLFVTSHFSGAAVLDGAAGDDILWVSGVNDQIRLSPGNDVVRVFKNEVLAQRAVTVTDVLHNNPIGPFLTTWLNSGGENGVLGAPTDSAQPGTGNVWSQRFEGGLLYSSPQTGMLVVPFHLPSGATSLFDPAYDAVRAKLLSQFFYNGFIAERVFDVSTATPSDPHQAIKFGDQTKVMGDALLQFSQEATILQNGGFDPGPAENVVRILLNAFDQLDNEAVAALYGANNVHPGFFVRDFVGQSGPERQGIPLSFAIDGSDFISSLGGSTCPGSPGTGIPLGAG